MYLLCGAMSLHHLAIMTKPSLSCLLCFLCMLAIPIFPFLKVEEFLIYLSRLFFNFIQTGSNMYMYICIIFTSPSPSPPFFPHCSITMRFVTKMAGFVHVHICTWTKLAILVSFYNYILTVSNMMTNVIVCMLASLKLYM